MFSMGFAAAVVAGCCNATHHLLVRSSPPRLVSRVVPLVGFGRAILNQGRQRSLPESRPSRIRCATALFFWRDHFATSLPPRWRIVCASVATSCMGVDVAELGGVGCRMVFFG